MSLSTSIPSMALFLTAFSQGELDTAIPSDHSWQAPQTQNRPAGTNIYWYTAKLLPTLQWSLYMDRSASILATLLLLCLWHLAPDCIWFQNAASTLLQHRHGQLQSSCTRSCQHRQQHRVFECIAVVEISQSAIQPLQQAACGSGLCCLLEPCRAGDAAHAMMLLHLLILLLLILLLLLRLLFLSLLLLLLLKACVRIQMYNNHVNASVCLMQTCIIATQHSKK